MIRLHKPTIKRKDMDAVLNCMVSEQIAPGEKYRDFAAALKRQFQAADVHLLRSYPKAIELGLKALGVNAGSRVAVSTLSPGCYSAAAAAAGAEITCCDILPRILTLDPDKADPESSAAVVHAPLGLFPDPQIYASLQVPVLEDITQSFGCLRGESKPGDIGSILVMGLEEHDMITAGGGAALIVKDRSCASAVKQLIDQEGYLSLLPDMNAALGLTQLTLFEDHLKRRREFFELFYKSLLKTRHHTMIEIDEQVFSSCYTFPVLLESDIRSVMKFCRTYKVEIASAFERCVLTALDEEAQNYPQSVPYVLRAINFPLYPLLSQDQTKTLVRVLAALP